MKKYNGEVEKNSTIDATFAFSTIKRELSNSEFNNLSGIKEIDESMRTGGEKVNLTKNAISEVLIDSVLFNNIDKTANITAFEMSREEIELLQNHPFMEAIPFMANEERDSLLDDIQANGFTGIITITKDMVIVDGRERINLIINKEIIHIPLFVYYEGNEESIIDFIMSKNIQRRHLLKGQKAAMSLKFYDILKDKSHSKRTQRMFESVESEKSDSRTEVAKYFGISSSYIGKALKVKNHENTALFQEVFEGKIALEKAYNQINNVEIVTSVNNEQEEIIDSVLNGFESEYGVNKLIVTETISLLTKLGVKSNTAQKLIIHRIKKELEKKEAWSKKSDDAKFKKYLKDFTECMRRSIGNIEFKKFHSKINAFKSRINLGKLDEKIEHLKGICTKKEFNFLVKSINAVNTSMSEFTDDEKFETIIMKYVELVSGELNVKK